MKWVMWKVYGFSADEKREKTGKYKWAVLARHIHSVHSVRVWVPLLTFFFFCLFLALRTSRKFWCFVLSLRKTKTKMNARLEFMFVVGWHPVRGRFRMAKFFVTPTSFCRYIVVALSCGVKPDIYQGLCALVVFCGNSNINVDSSSRWLSAIPW